MFFLGLVFKPGIDGIRDSPARSIVEDSLAQETKLEAYDPIANNEVMRPFGHNKTVSSDNLSQPIDKADAVLLLTPWEDFGIGPELLVQSDPQPLFVDGRRLLAKCHIKRYEGTVF